MRDLADCVQEALGQIAVDHAADPALTIVEAIRFRFGGSQLYIPMPARPNCAARHAEIRAAFTGKNHRELARRHGLSVGTVYDILAAGRKAKR